MNLRFEASTGSMPQDMKPLEKKYHEEKHGRKPKKEGVKGKGKRD